MVTIPQDSLKRLQGLFVADIMSRDVAVIPETAVMDEAAAILTARGGSGAPVVDLHGRCIGVLSAVDFLRFDKIAGAFDCSRLDVSDRSECWQLPWNSVQRYMTAPVHTVSPAAPMMHAAELMCAEHIHRLIVLDDREVPVGVISTLDIVAAVVHAVDENRLAQRFIERRNGK